MKRMLSLALVLALFAGLAIGCGGDKKGGKDNTAKKGGDTNEAPANE